MTTELVEIGFDLTSTGGPFLVLDDPIQGQLDNVDWVLGGTLYYDVTDRVRSISISRGKSNQIDTISAGEAIVELNNRDRAFDPTYTASPFYGNIIPKRQVRISTNGIAQYEGSVDDWNLTYTPDGDAVAAFIASDGFVYLNNQTLPASTATPQTSGARISAILDDPSVNWPATQRNIDTGAATLGADVISEGTGALAYIQLVEQSELGSFFIAKNGYATFKDRTVAPTSTTIVNLADDGTGIKYQDLTVVYGSEELYNEITVSSVITSGQVTVSDTDSQNAYGIFNLTLSDLLLADDTQVEDLATFLAGKYSTPNYRFDSVNVRLTELSETNQNKVLGLELGDVAKITFTPSNLPPAIVRYAEVIRINHSVDINGDHIVNLGLSTLDFTYLVLDDAVFGKLDDNNALGF